ncbi:TonB-dependent receptor [Maricaulis sp.]|uniref:TonB-dependent receptor n=1 Tax=Maricaulis sp. TaxID=1486257 RepID=UPI00261201AE|nr:TonB-dependent receptor [Maricaulis sp.]
MTRTLFASTSVFALLAAPAAADHPLVDIITIHSQTPAHDTTQVLSPETLPPNAGPDPAALIARLPGAAAIGNGALSGQMQYRGLFGSRINIRIDDHAFASGGPNLMDPPLHYAPLPLVERFELDRGLSPVSAGPGLGGGLNAVLKRSQFGDSAGFTPQFDWSFSARSVDESYAAGGLTGIANERWRFHALYSIENGSDVESPRGMLAGTEHNRLVYGLGAGWRSDGHEISLDLRRTETGETGNPPFAMDIRYFDTDMARLAYTIDLGEQQIRLSAGYSDVAHAMSNFRLRPAPPAMRQRETFAYATTKTLSAEYELPAMGGQITFGTDLSRSEHDVTITNPNNAGFYLGSFAGIEVDRTGVFAEWTGTGPLGWSAEIGLRADHHQARGGEAFTGPAVPMGPSMLAVGYNAGELDWDDSTIDVAGRFWREVSDTLTARFALAHKSRVPGYVERFAWLPTPASGGLADGNTYVGDRQLEPETAIIAEAGFDWQGGRAYARPTVYWREIDDYIQGVPFDDTPGVINSPVEMISNMNGDPTPLRFANVEARLYGFDLDFGYRLSERWHVDGVASWVRGERRDIDDNLYRIAPPSLRLGATYESGAWYATLEGLVVAEQDRVSRSNSEQATDGYAIANAYAGWSLGDGMTLALSAENLLDEDYEQHLAGYNRNAASVVGLGERLPGTGRSIGLRLSLQR